MTIYAPRALRHFRMAAMEARAHRGESPSRPEPVEVSPAKVGPAKVGPAKFGPAKVQPMRPRTVVRLWLPMTPIFVLLAPFAFLLAPLIYFAPRPYNVRPLGTVLGVGQLLLSLGGTVVDVDTPDALVSIRIF